MFLLLLCDLLLKSFGSSALRAGASTLVSNHLNNFDLLSLDLLGVLNLLDFLDLFSNLFVHLLESLLALQCQFRAHHFLLSKLGCLGTGRKVTLLLFYDLLGCCLASDSLMLLPINFMNEMLL